MNLSRTWLRVPTVTCILLALPLLLCGANGKGCGGDDIPIGNDGGGPGQGGNPGGPPTCDPSACGPTLGMPSHVCPDGTVAGPTGKCIQSSDGQCGWEVISCPDACQKADCGPEPGMPSQVCDDGSIGGFTGQCIMQNGKCGWEIRPCPNALMWWSLCGDPVCSGQFTDHPNVPNCTASDLAGASCNSAGTICEVVGDTCGAKLECAPSDPTNGGPCPVSRAKYKNGIQYVGDAELGRVHDELLRMKLARWHYNGEASSMREHFGFIIDDDPASPAVAASGEHVDLYGYASMAAAAIQVQAKQIEALEREVQLLRDEVVRSRR